jgi:purine-binding chemotaxis protein CheW
MIICKYIEKRGRKMSKYVIIKVENQNFGISTENVEKILKLVDISKIPDSSYYVEGVINYQEKILPLINIKKLFSMTETDVKSNSSIIIISHDGKRAGIIVDEVDDIEETTDNKNSGQIQSQYIEEIKILNGNVISILSPNIISSI